MNKLPSLASIAFYLRAWRHYCASARPALLSLVFAAGGWISTPALQAQDTSEANGQMVEVMPESVITADNGEAMPLPETTESTLPASEGAEVTDTLVEEAIISEEPAVDTADQLMVVEDVAELLPEEGAVTLQFPEAPAAAGAQIDPLADETISVDFPNEEIRVILRNVADLFDLNLVIPDGLMGNASIKLRNVTWRQVFSVVLEPVGFTFVIDQNIVKIRSREELEREPLDTRVFLINSARAVELQSAIQPLINTGAGGRIQVDQRTNALVITERPSRMNNIQEIIDRLDRPTAQVMIESKFVELTLEDRRTLGVDWNFDGLNLASLAGSYSVPLTGGASAASGVIFSEGQLNAILRALQTNNRANLVSNPTVVTLDNEPIFIHVGETITVVYPSINNQTGTETPGEREKIEIGIKLRVRPQVSNHGFINLTVNPEVSSIIGEREYFGADYPTIAVRRLTDAKISIKDGYTLAIGGLIENNRRKEIRQVPLLGDIPLLGRLFQTEIKNDLDRNLIIFITARTLDPDGSTYRDVIDPRQINRMNITADEIPGYTDRSRGEIDGVVKIPQAELDKLDEIQAERNQEARFLEMERLQEQLRKQRELENRQNSNTSTVRTGPRR